MTEKIKPIIEEPEVVIKKAIRKTVLLVVLFLLITTGGIFFVIKKTKAMSQNLQNKQNLIYLANRQIQFATEIMRQWKVIEPNVTKIDNALPPSNDLLGYLGGLEKIATEAGVSQNVKLQTSTASGTSKTTPVNLPGQVAKGKGGSVEHTIEIKGSLEQVVQYLILLEKAPYFTKVTSFNITNTGATLGMKVYTYD